MSFSQLRKMPSRIFNRMSNWGGRNDEVNLTAPVGSIGKKHSGSCTNVAESGNEGNEGRVGGWKKQRQRYQSVSESSSDPDQGGTFFLRVELDLIRKILVRPKPINRQP